MCIRDRYGSKRYICTHFLHNLFFFVQTGANSVPIIQHENERSGGYRNEMEQMIYVFFYYFDKYANSKSKLILH